MSKKVFNVFSILCFALVLCFMGCTELINPKTETDINLKIDLSKIIKSTRNTEEIQSSVSLGENPTIKVAIYDAKKYNATTNSTDNLDLITEAQAKIVNNEAKVKLNNIPVGIDAIVFAELSFSNGNSTEVMYAGNSEVFKVKASDNKVSLVLMKVEVDIEVKPDDSKPEEIINAKEPIITTQPESHIKIYSSDTGEDFPYELKITAESSDNGKISYKWQKLDNENWVDIENSSLDKITVIVSKNTSCVYRCVVTNTNENVNGEKTASIYSNEVTVAYVEGSLTSITAEYTGSYELLGKDFTYSNVSVTETYTSSDDAETPITVIADKNRYTISPTDSEDAIGYVPYTVTHNNSNLTKDITVPVKYELDANNLVLETCFNSICVSESDTYNAIKIPQYGTVKYSYQISDNIFYIFDENGNKIEIKDINIINSDEQYFKATITSDGTNIENEDTCNVVGTYIYTVTLQSANEWFVCNLNTSKDFSVVVCPWKIILTMNDGSTVDTNNISLGTYTLSISNEAYTSTSQNPPPATFSCLVDNKNIITNNELTIDEVFTTGKITASIKINEKEVEVASLEISIVNTSVTYAEGLTCEVDSVGTVTLYISNADGLATFRNIVNGSFNSDIIVVNDSNQNSNHKFTANTLYPSVNGILRDSITLSGEWTPIGKSSTDGYKGTFDGAKHEIKGLNIESSDTNNPQGLFCSVYGGTVKNLVVQGLITSSCYTGGITGYLNGGTIENCVNNVEITNSATNGTTGGIVGYVENSTATIKNCVNMAKVESTQSTVGGIVGATGVMTETSNVSISKCINMGEISASSIVAGILGLAYPITIENCINLGKVISTNVLCAAGIVIPSEDDVSVTVTNCINAGNVVTNNGSVGAISTSTKGTYTNNYYDSTINSNVLDSDINGITGQLTTELIGSNLSLNGISGDQWSFVEGCYPLPDITETIPGGANGEIWSAVIEAATPGNTSTSGGVTYSIGDVYYQNNTPMGVVFKTDTEYVYIVGLDEGNFTYGTQNCVTYIKNASNVTFDNSSDGCQNMTNWYSFITTNSVDFSSAEFPAFNYCLTYRDTEGEGGTWYLPSKEELSMIQYNIEILNNTLQNTLQSQNATPLATSYSYWSSTYTSAGKAYKVVMNINGSQDENSLDTTCYVRPCKRIKINHGSSDVLIKGLGVDTACRAISNIYTEGEHYIKLDSSVTADKLEDDIYIKLNENLSKNKLLDSYGNPTAFVYLDLSSTQITELPPPTFYRLTNLSGITLPSTIETIDASAFQGCINLTKFVVPADNPYFTVDESNPAILLSKDESKLISYPSATGEYIIPDNITSLAEYTFGDATNLTSVTIHANLTDIPSNAFYGACNLKTFTVNSSNSEYTTDETFEILLSKDGTELISWPYACDEIIIPDSVTKIADYALSMSYITSVNLNNVVEIGDFAFYYTDIEKLTIPSSVTKIGKYAFYSCENLQSVEFADTNGWSVVNDEDEQKSIDVTVNNLIYASDDVTPGYADYTWIKDSSGTSGGGIANYTDTNGILISNYQYQKTSLVTVISQETTINCSDEGEGVFNLYYGGFVTLSPFAMGQYEVTQELYQAIMTETPSYFKDTNITSGETQNLRPVDSVNWYEAVAFCNELTKKTMGDEYCVYYTDDSCSTVYTANDATSKTLPYFDQSQKGYRLPTEAEWEFSARGGKETEPDWNYAYPGIDINDDGSSDNLITVAWFEYLETYEKNTCTHEVGLKLQNRLNLFDMAGNVQEWCWDLPISDEDTTYYNQNVTNPIGSNISNEERIVRGGYWEDVADSCKCTYRFQEKAIPTNSYSPNTLGFRICRSL